MALEGGWAARSWHAGSSTSSRTTPNIGVANELMSEDFVHQLPYRGLPPGRARMRAAGELVTSVIHDIHVEIPLILTEGDLVADRSSSRLRAAPGRH